MNTQRLEQLIAFLKEDPLDPFNLYAIGIEYVSSEPLKALEYFDQVLKQHPKYVPVYFHAAALYRLLGETTKASNLYQYGIREASAQNNRHALRELQAAYQEFLDDMDEI